MEVSQSPEPDPLEVAVTKLHGVGAERAVLLERLGIRTVGDLLLHRPRRYEDRRNFSTISRLLSGQVALTCGKVVAMGTKYYAKRTKCIFEIVLDDGTARLHCRWWNLRYMEKYFQPGDEVVACGKVAGVKPRTMDHPETEVVDRGPEGSPHMGRIVPIYPLTEGLSQRWLRGLVWRTVQGLGQDGEKPDAASAHPQGRLFEAKDLPGGCQGFPAFALPYGEAIRLMHMPDDPADPERARRRLAADEFLDFQRHLQRRRKKFETRAHGLPCGGNNTLIKPLLRHLGFKLTDAQTRVLKEIRRDMSGAHPMRRLLQGDVGSGKTLVAFCAALMAIESGYSVALMAPTEILAEQHFRTALKWLSPLGVDVHILTGSRKTTGSGEPGGKPPFFIGTHALIEPTFAPQNLGFVIIDEQHKFGVSQREELLRKGRYPHLLVMTATPIPRTLGLTLYGDLDASVLDEMPPGRGRIRTFVREQRALAKVWEFVKTQLKAGRQAYIVYPRIEETSGNVKAVTLEFEQIRSALAPFTAGMLHGKVSPAEREVVMAAFVQNNLSALLATSLVEVGVDVPNATVMVVENAEQFGLAQLHQLRGRIGRGAHESYCILVSGAREPEVAERLKIMERSSDGFEIAEADLAIRGPGEFLGRDQSGAPDFRFGDLAKDLDLLREARRVALQSIEAEENAAGRREPISVPETGGRTRNAT